MTEEQCYVVFAGEVASFLQGIDDTRPKISTTQEQRQRVNEEICQESTSQGYLVQ